MEFSQIRQSIGFKVFLAIMFVAVIQAISLYLVTYPILHDDLQKQELELVTTVINRIHIEMIILAILGGAGVSYYINRVLKSRTSQVKQSLDKIIKRNEQDDIEEQAENEDEKQDELTELSNAFNQVLATAQDKQHRSSKRLGDLQALLDHVPMLISVRDLQGRILFVNKTLLKTFQIEKFELLGQQSPISGKHLDYFYLDALDSDIGLTSNLLYKEKQVLIGTEKHIFESKKYPLYDQNGNRYAICETSLDISEKRQIENVFSSINQKLSSASGQNYLDELVKHIWKMFGLKYVLISRFEEGGLAKTLSVCVKGDIKDNIYYQLKGTPCEKVSGNTTCLYRDNIQNLFPEDQLLVEMGAQSYIGTPLIDSSNQVIGSIVMMDDNPIGKSEHIVESLKHFASKTTAELQRIEAINELLAARQKLSLHIEETPLGVIEWGVDGSILSWNKSAERIFGYTKDEVVSKKTYECIVPPNAQGAISKVWMELMQNRGGRRSTNDNITKDGKIICCEWYNTPLVTEEGNVIGVASLIQDITSSQMVLKALLRKEQDQREILNSMTDAVITIDEKGIISSFNNAAEKLLQYSQTEIIGERINLLMPTDVSEKHDSYLNAYITTGVKKIIGRDREVNIKTKHGDLVPCRLSISELPVSQDGNKRFIGTCHDLREVKRQEEQIRRSQKMEALGKLTGGIAHDFNNLLGVILGYSNLLTCSLNGDPKLKKYADEISRASERGAKLTKNLFSFSRKQASHAKNVQINELLCHSHDMLQTTLTPLINLDFKLNKDLWLVSIDESDFEDALLNLSINAMHAMDGSGSLIFTTDNVYLNDQESQSFRIPSGDYVIFSIKDTGCGMDKKTMDKVFDPFYSTKGEKGTGMGLSQVYGFVERSNGDIKVSSKLGQGTEFVIYLPRISPKESETVEKAVNNKLLEIKGDDRILLVDDEKELLCVTAETLEQNGYTVFTAENAKQALKLLEQESVSLVISDVIMPEIDGFELAEMIEKQYPDIKIQLASGYSGDKHVKVKNQSLYENMLNKPINPDQLLKRVRKVLES